LEGAQRPPAVGSWPHFSEHKIEIPPPKTTLVAMSFTYTIAHASSINLNILRVHAPEPKYGLIKPTILAHMPYFIKRNPDAEYMSTVEVEDIFKRNRWLSRNTTPLTRDVARTLNPMLPVICDECPFNRCVHLFPEIKCDGAFKHNCQGDAISSVRIKCMTNPDMRSNIACVVPVDASEHYIQDVITRHLARSHAYVIKDLRTPTDQYCTNEMLDTIIYGMRRKWTLAYISSRAALVGREIMVICELCSPESTVCDHIYHEKRNPEICAQMFARPPKEQTHYDTLRAVLRTLVPFINRTSKVWYVAIDSVDPQLIKDLCAMAKCVDIAQYVEHAVGNKKLCYNDLGDIYFPDQSYVNTLH
jgi:hypothetical protein